MGSRYVTLQLATVKETCKQLGNKLDGIALADQSQLFSRDISVSMMERQLLLKTLCPYDPICHTFYCAYRRHVAIEEGCRWSLLVDVWGSSKSGGIYVTHSWPGDRNLSVRQTDVLLVIEITNSCRYSENVLQGCPDVRWLLFSYPYHYVIIPRFPIELDKYLVLTWKCDYSVFLVTLSTQNSILSLVCIHFSWLDPPFNWPTVQLPSVSSRQRHYWKEAEFLSA